jgi:fructose-bisphosphate aldolase, class II
MALRLAEEGVAFDSIMVDASHADTDEENLEIVRNCPTGEEIDSD